MGIKEKAEKALTKAFKLKDKKSFDVYFYEHMITAISIAIKGAKKEVFDTIEIELYHKDKKHFEYNSEATFRKLKELKKKHLQTG